MKKRISVLLMVFLLTASTGYSTDKDIAGISMPSMLMNSASMIFLNGAGVRSKFFMKLYVGGLYLQQPNSNPKEIISADAPMGIRLHIISSHITGQEMEDGVKEGFEKSTNGNTAPLKGQIEKFISVFRDKLKENDIYDFIYTPNKGIEVYKNTKLVEVIEGLAFKQALFGIWLSDNPVQESLKKEMLGK